MSVQRPLSPFMLGSYYRVQLTSLLSILHRITGLLLCLGAIVLVCWVVALAGGPETYARFESLAHSLPGKVMAVAFVLSLSYHLGNGIRHLFWDAGKGFDLKTAYASGYAVVAFAVALSAIVLSCLNGAQP